ncbi:hypothetical protein [Sphingobium sp. LSP13-1-1.1]|uniref:hypothetical protein n=1 Tax=Sphingobium sp. LSP13-1-1.1 TaxID=3135234 RepID=UPI003416E6E1
MSLNLGPLEVTEHILALARRLEGEKWCPYSAVNIDGRPWTVADRLAQARMWRQYAGAWDDIKIDHGFVGYPHGHRVIIGRSWVEGILRISKAECIRRSRANFYLAKRIKRRIDPAPAPRP